MNVALLNEAVDFARRTAAGETLTVAGRPAVWDQEVYSDFDTDHHACGTAFCIAGYITAQHPHYRIEPQLDGFIEYIGDQRLDFDVFHDEIADSLLGLEYGDTSALYEGSNSLETVEEIAVEIIAEHT